MGFTIERCTNKTYSIFITTFTFDEEVTGPGMDYRNLVVISKCLRYSEQ